MEPVYAVRLAELRKSWCKADFVRELLGLDLVGDQRLTGSFRAWARRFLGTEDVVRGSQHGLSVDRWALETFLVQNGLISWKWAAVYLGMDERTMRTIVDRLEGQGVSTQIPSGVSDQVVRQREATQLFKAFPAIRNRIFSDHSRMCRAVHEAVRADLGSTWPPWCA